MQQKGVKVELINGSLCVMFAYDPDMVVRVKRLPGARWNNQLKAWQFPITPMVYKKVKKEFNITCMELERALTFQKVKLKHYTFKTPPMQHQKEALRFMLSQLGFEVIDD